MRVVRALQCPLLSAVTFGARSSKYGYLTWAKRAEREGFEPSEDLHPQRFSRPSHSSALAPLPNGDGQGYRARREAKNDESWAEHSSARTPATTSTSWLRRGSTHRL